MVNYLLDTCFLSEVLKPRQNAGVRAWLSEQREERLCVSVISIGELTKGIYKLQEAPRRQRIREWLEGELKPRFQNRLLNVDAEIAEVWGELCGTSAQQGRTLPVMDAWIAATALRHHLRVVTRNVSDLERCGAKVLNPWSPD